MLTEKYGRTNQRQNDTRVCPVSLSEGVNCMADNNGTKWLMEEVADFLASCPDAEEILAFRPSARTSRRLSALVAKSKAGTLGANEQWELDQFEHVELLMQSIKAKLRPARPV